MSSGKMLARKKGSKVVSSLTWSTAASPYATERDRSAVLSDNWPGHHIALEHTEPKTVLQKGIKEQAVHFVTAADLLLTMKLTTSRSNNQTGGHTQFYIQS